MNFNLLKSLILLLFVVNLVSCNGKLPGGDARENPPDPQERVKKNIEEGRGFRLMDTVSNKGSGNFEFASSNELWRATLDTIDFMPLALANYSGGIIVTDWYSEGGAKNESIKISVRFLTNEVRSDALDVKVFYKKCMSIENCKIYQQDGILVAELTKKILSKAALYKKEKKEKNKKPYVGKLKKKGE